MKVQCLNSSSIKTRNLIKKALIKTRNLIKKAFAELINEKKHLNKITVTELTTRAGITRSTFYTHYENIYDLASEYQLQTIELLCNEDLKLHSKSDILEYFDNIFKCLKDNEDAYKLLLRANDTLIFLDKLKKIAEEKIYDALKNITKDNYLDLTISFIMNGIVVEILKYFRGESKYSLDELLINIKTYFKKIFNY